jgi:hypothetical protein
MNGAIIFICITIVYLAFLSGLYCEYKFDGGNIYVVAIALWSTWYLYLLYVFLKGILR